MVVCTLALVQRASNPVSVRQPTGSLHAPFSADLTDDAWRFASVPVTKSREDFHLLVDAHAGHTNPRPGMHACRGFPHPSPDPRAPWGEIGPMAPTHPSHGPGGWKCPQGTLSWEPGASVPGGGRRSHGCRGFQPPTAEGAAESRSRTRLDDSGPIVVGAKKALEPGPHPQVGTKKVLKSAQRAPRRRTKHSGRSCTRKSVRKKCSSRSHFRKSVRKKYSSRSNDRRDAETSTRVGPPSGCGAEESTLAGAATFAAPRKALWPERRPPRCRRKHSGRGDFRMRPGGKYFRHAGRDRGAEACARPGVATFARRSAPLRRRQRSSPRRRRPTPPPPPSRSPRRCRWEGTPCPRQPGRACRVPRRRAPPGGPTRR